MFGGIGAVWMLSWFDLLRIEVLGIVRFLLLALDAKISAHTHTSTSTSTWNTTF